MAFRTNACAVVFVLCLSLVFAFSGEIAAQQTGTRRLLLTRTATLGTVDEKSAVSSTEMVAFDAQRRIYVGMADVGEVRVFDARGTFLRAIGRRGAGPGEFEGIAGVSLDAADSLLVYDPRLSRISVFAPAPSYRYTRSVAVPPGVSPENALQRLDNRLFVLNTTVMGRNGMTQSVHFIDASNGGATRSFGPEIPFRTFYTFQTAGRFSIAAVKSGIWTLRSNEFLLEKWDLNGNRTQQMRFENTWFQPYHKNADLNTEPSNPIPRGLQVDSAGLLWVLIQAPSADQAKYRAVSSRAGEKAATFTDNVGAFDTIIQVIDPASRRVVAAGRVDHQVMAVPKAGWMVTYRQDAEGVPLLDVWRVEMR